MLNACSDCSQKRVGGRTFSNIGRRAEVEVFG